MPPTSSDTAAMLTKQRRHHCLLVDSAVLAMSRLRKDEEVVVVAFADLVALAQQLRDLVLRLRHLRLARAAETLMPWRCVIPSSLLRGRPRNGHDVVLVAAHMPALVDEHADDLGACRLMRMVSYFGSSVPNKLVAHLQAKHAHLRGAAHVESVNIAPLSIGHWRMSSTPAPRLDGRAPVLVAEHDLRATPHAGRDGDDRRDIPS